MTRWIVAAWLALAVGCATDPMARLESYTPTLSPGQVAELRKRSVSLQSVSMGVVDAPQTITMPLETVNSEKPDEPGGRHRMPVVLATVNGKNGVRVLLDSGSNQNLFGYSLAHSLGIPIIGDLKPVSAMGIGGAVDNYPASVPEMMLDSLTFRNMPALIGPDAQALSFTRGFWSDTQVMILGVGTLRRLSYLTIDAMRGTAILSPRDTYLPDESSKFVTAVPLRWDGGLPVVQITIDKRGPYPCIVDTGGDYGLLLPRARAAEFGYWKPGKGPLTASRGVGGASLDTRYEVREAKLGNATIVAIPAHTGLIGPEPGGGQILLGNVVLRRYRVTFDFKNSVMWLER